MSLEHTVTMTITVRPLTVSPRELLSPDSRVSISTSLTRKGSGDERGWDTRRESHTQAQGANQRENHTARPCILGSLPVITRALGERRATGSQGEALCFKQQTDDQKKKLVQWSGFPKRDVTLGPSSTLNRCFSFCTHLCSGQILYLLMPLKWLRVCWPESNRCMIQVQLKTASPEEERPQAQGNQQLTMPHLSRFFTCFSDPFGDSFASRWKASWAQGGCSASRLSQHPTEAESLSFPYATLLGVRKPFPEVPPIFGGQGWVTHLVLSQLHLLVSWLRFIGIGEGMPGVSCHNYYAQMTKSEAKVSH